MFSTTLFLCFSAEIVMCAILPRDRNLHPCADTRDTRRYLDYTQLSIWNQQAQDVNHQLWRLSGHYDQLHNLESPAEFSLNRHMLAMDGLHLSHRGHKVLCDNIFVISFLLLLLLVYCEFYHLCGWKKSIKLLLPSILFPCVLLETCVVGKV